MKPNELNTAGDRLREIASILAGGILRLRRRTALPGDQAAKPEIPTDSAPNCLDVATDSRLSVHVG